MTIKKDVKRNIKPLILLFVLGFVGILAVVALLPQMLSQQAASLPIPVKVLQLISMAQLSVLLLAMIFVGAVFAKKVALTSPVILALAHSGDTFQALKPQLAPALIGGVLGGGLSLLSLACCMNSFQQVLLVQRSTLLSLGMPKCCMAV